MTKKFIGGLLVVGLAVAFTIASPVQMAAAGESLTEDNEMFQRGLNQSLCYRSEDLNEEELDKRQQERDEAKINQVVNAIEKELISEKEGKDIIETIKNNDFERGDCLEEGPRNNKNNLNITDEIENDNSREFGNGRQNRRGSRGCRN
ncbi:hypothetical protein [Natranaerobius trueperi]|uniref:Secreted protein n=1 Tax=Natranaerobius trueperi TaxID=759412 RepID=A0A226BXQ1_9FIRM|nr:hypothetical protein [Natranaerobius trueperi]OWZ82979.1 hypothetical protein CDO51_11130 [Natranaerobius trueperi]